MGMFPHTVEGSLVDIGDDQYVNPLFYTLYTLYTPFIHLHYHIYTYVHPLYMYIHHIYT